MCEAPGLSLGWQKHVLEICCCLLVVPRLNSQLSISRVRAHVSSITLFKKQFC